MSESSVQGSRLLGQPRDLREDTIWPPAMERGVHSNPWSQAPLFLYGFSTDADRRRPVLAFPLDLAASCIYA